MPTRVFLFFGVIAVTTIICYLQRYRPPEQVRLRRRKLDVPFNDSGCLTELDDQHARQAGLVPTLTPDQIRAAFGNN